MSGMDDIDPGMQIEVKQNQSREVFKTEILKRELWAQTFDYCTIQRSGGAGQEQVGAHEHPY